MTAPEPVVLGGPAPDAAACSLRNLADSARLLIVRHLALGDHRAVDLVTHLGVAQSTVSTHLACPRHCGLASSRPRGRASAWPLSAQPELMDLLAAAERLLAATGDGVTLCPTCGTDAS